MAWPLNWCFVKTPEPPIFIMRSERLTAKLKKQKKAKFDPNKDDKKICKEKHREKHHSEHYIEKARHKKQKKCVPKPTYYNNYNIDWKKQACAGSLNYFTHES